MRIQPVSAALLLAALVVLVGATGALGGNPHGTPPGQSSNQGSSSSGSGVKPSNDTGKNTDCSTGGGQGSSATCTANNPNTSTNPDASKRYGNGKTAAQIANSKGAPAGTHVTGPGNSQPHKICGRDVHAYGKGNGKTCASSQSNGGQQSNSGCTSNCSNAGTQAGVQSGTQAGVQSGTQSGTQAGVQSSSNSTSGVLGASKTGPAAKGATKPARSGVLGTSATLRSSTRSGTLPFTGLPLWIPALAAIAMIGAGLGLGRRRGWALPF